MLIDPQPLNVHIRQPQRADKHYRQHAHGALYRQPAPKRHRRNHDGACHPDEAQQDRDVPIHPMKQNHAVPDKGDKLHAGQYAGGYNGVQVHLDADTVEGECRVPVALADGGVVGAVVG